jgi:FtsH-binding integral membrane protein
MSRQDHPNDFQPPRDYDGYGHHASSNHDGYGQAPYGYGHAHAQAAGYPGAGYRVPAAQAIPEERMAFIQRTYAHVAGAVGAFILLVTALFQTPVPYLVTKFALGTSWLIILGIFMLLTWMADWWARSVTSRAVQYLGLGVGVVAYALMFMPMLVLAVHHSAPSVLPQAALTTLVVFGGLTAVVFVTKQDFSFLRMGLLVGGLLALGAIVAGVLFGFSLGLGFSIFMVGFSAACVLYYTSQVLHQYDTTQHVAASLSIFFGVMMLFWYILQLFMSRR